MKPSAVLIKFFALLCALGVPVVALPAALPLWTALLAGTVAVALVDAARLWRKPTPAAVRRIAHSMPLAVDRRIDIELHNPTAQAATLDLFDHHPVSFSCRGLPLTVTLQPDSHATRGYRARPTERGRQEFGPLEMRLYSPLKLWTRRVAVPLDTHVDVFPNFAAVAKYALLGADSTAMAGSMHLRPLRGEGSEFHQLREYRVGDTFRQIDWKATARIGKLITKEYQQERDQHIIFMIDTGRRMLAREQGLSHFDHVLNAMLLLSYVALRQGDAVGVMTCGEAPLWLAPRKGLSTVNRIATRLIDLQPEPVAIDYQAAATALAQRQKRRALVVLLTNIRDEDGDDLSSAFRLLRRRHVLLVASLREPGIDDALERPVRHLSDALTFAASHHYLASRRATHESLCGHGVIIEDTSCEALPQAITNRYMQIKRAGIL